ncbi:Protein of unknown function [Cotesia congregata]|uniref:DUF4371 domain-containing protein n=1 Tax=Cotesia congregata TaxID=51543 RepID=A0A8J2HIT6_COTCN|nr:Protein of unknown function [Cotesia congregata]
MTNAKHYREAWENQPIFKGWLTKNSSELITAGHGEARCKFCKASLRAHASDLKKHAGTGSHLAQAKLWNIKKQPSLISHINSSQQKELKIAELKMVLYIASHSSVKSVDHLGEVLKELGKGSQLEKLRLHRTKASKLMLNVVAPAMLEELIDDIGEQDYSIILDESTDVSTIKYMAYCVRYFMFTATAESLFKNFKEFLTKVGLNINKLVAIGTDGANNICGFKHSLFTLIRKEYPNVQLMKCSCHSLSLCASKASDELPASVEFLLRESRNWFSRSPLRQTTYKNMYEKLSSGNKPPKLVQLSDTRWLAWTNEVSVVLKQWDALKGFFVQLEASPTNKCIIARNLGQMYRDDSNLLYLIFLDTVLKEVTDLNIAFQKANADITKLYSELRRLLLSVA